MADKPEETPEKPSKDAEKPAEVVEQPAEVVEKPAEVVEKPAEDAEKPAEVVEKPSEGAEKPAEGAEKVAEGADKSAEAAPKPTETPEVTEPAKTEDQIKKTDETTAKTTEPTTEESKIEPENVSPDSHETGSGDQTVIPIEAETDKEGEATTAETTAGEKSATETKPETKKKQFKFFTPYQPTTEKIEGQSAFKRCYTRRAVWITILVFLLAIFILIACAVFIAVTKEPKSGPLANTECGKVEGLIFEGGVEFRGIPYALPPVGVLRWKPPKKPSHYDKTCWKGTLNATVFGNSCFQRNIYLDKGSSPFLGSEDCLYLNVWTPTQNVKANLPVAVFVHGGFLANFNGNWPRYRPNIKLASSSGMVFVSMNYRLHAFGFMALDILSKQSPHGVSGNYGFMDIIMALQWVKRNIHNFGGDPSQVSLFGQSSGGTAVMALMTSPLSAGLFHRAWISSGSAFYETPLTQASTDNLIFLKRTGCTDIKCLYRLSPENITNAVPWDEFPDWTMLATLDLPEKNESFGAICVVDGYVIPKPPLEALSRGEAMKIPLLIGSTAEETDFFPSPDSVRMWTWVNYTQHVTEKLDTFSGNISEKTLEMYPPSNYSSVECVYTSLVSNIRVNCPLQEIAYGAANSIPVYSYVVTYRASQPIIFDGYKHPSVCSGHCLDILGLFGVLDKFIDIPTEDDVSFGNIVAEEFIHFLKYGKPKSTSWQKFPLKTALLDKRIKYIEGAYKSEECAFWRRHGFFRYSWIN